MSTVMVRLSDAKHERLKEFARRRRTSVTKLVEEWTTVALAQFDAENRLKLRATRGDTKKGLALLDKLDKAFTGKRAARKAQS
jgi:predicted transcriptional regulator